MTAAELDAIIEAGTERCDNANPPWASNRRSTDVILPLALAADLVRAARELRELRRDATSRDGAL